MFCFSGCLKLKALLVQIFNRDGSVVNWIRASPQPGSDGYVWQEYQNQVSQQPKDLTIKFPKDHQNKTKINRNRYGKGHGDPSYDQGRGSGGGGGGGGGASDGQSSNPA